MIAALSTESWLIIIVGVIVIVGLLASLGRRGRI